MTKTLQPTTDVIRDTIVLTDELKHLLDEYINYSSYNFSHKYPDVIDDDVYKSLISITKEGELLLPMYYTEELGELGNWYFQATYSITKKLQYTEVYGGSNGGIHVVTIDEFATHDEFRETFENLCESEMYLQDKEIHYDELDELDNCLLTNDYQELLAEYKKTYTKSTITIGDKTCGNNLEDCL